MAIDPEEAPTVVGIGLICRGGAYLVRRRPEGSAMAGYWEFPGGKAEAGESPDRTAARECLEEVGVEVRVGELFHRVVHRYPHGLVELHYYRCSTGGEPDDGSGFRWIPLGELLGYRFPEANDEVIAALIRDADRPKQANRDEP